MNPPGRDREAWAPIAVPSRARIAHALERPGDRLEDLERYYFPGRLLGSPAVYSAGLYPPT